jgi:Carboxypeptidase regulatory-like domain
MNAMKAAAIAMCCVVLAGAAISIAANVGPREMIVDNFRILVTSEGKPLEGIEVEFYQREVLRCSVLTNKYGIAAPCKLAFGDYSVVIGIGYSEPALLLHVVENGQSGDIEVKETPAVLMIPKDLPTGRQLRLFHGTVIDPAGAVVPAARVRVVRRVNGYPTVLRTKTDASGEFSGSLDEGPYVALVSAHGFKVAVVPFEIDQNSWGSDLRVPVKIGN